MRGFRSPRVLVVFGTRPEAIKMAPVCRALEEDGSFEVLTLLSGQHREMLMQVVDFFGIRISGNLDVMVEGQTLDYVTSSVLCGVGAFLDSNPVDVVLVHGDTTTTLAAALAAFYRGVPVGHVEAGLRSGDLRRPFPEEMNRRLTDVISSFLFAPTRRAAENLAREGVSGEVFVTGNTVVDALYWALDLAKEPNNADLKKIPPHKKVVSVTLHRRESWGEPARQICLAVRDVVLSREDVLVVFSVHPNPAVRSIVEEVLEGLDRVLLVPPLPYGDFVWLLSRSRLVLSDSGGVQEECATLGVPVLVLRDVTERPEVLESGFGLLVGRDRSRVASEALRCLEEPASGGMRRTGEESPFGDGLASKRIADILKRRLL